MKLIFSQFLLLVMVFFGSNLSFAATTSSLQPINLMLDWFVNPDHAPLFVAKELGYFRQEGLEVNFITPSDPADPAKLLAAQKVDIAIDYQPHYLFGVANGLPLQQVGVLVGQPLNCLAVLETSSIKTIADLKSKRVGVATSGDVGEVMLKMMLEKRGLNLENIERVHVGYGLVQGLLTQRVDAVIGIMRNVEVVEFNQTGHPVRLFYPEKEGFPSYDELMFEVHQDRKNDAFIAKFMKALQRGVVYLKQHPQESWQLFAKKYPELNTPVNQKSWMLSIPYFTDHPEKINKQQCLKLRDVLIQQTGTKIPESAC